MISVYKPSLKKVGSDDKLPECLAVTRSKQLAYSEFF